MAGGWRHRCQNGAGDAQLDYSGIVRVDGETGTMVKEGCRQGNASSHLLFMVMGPDRWKYIEAG